ncbi:hypothetical protein RJ640_003453 [Escallonia rubra]|uniref:Pathogenesis-related homeodomain protein n=1 Tax=Escallonia rubra TaxID=112253 RepID=A0AA88QRB6_9ASTE|nr:hypothetical protein RJ640_003453 [Escallonia rubra]
MPGAGKRKSHKEFGNSVHVKIGVETSHTKRSKPKFKSHGNSTELTMPKKKVNYISNDRRKDSTSRKLINKATLHKRKSQKKKSLFSSENPPSVNADGSEKHANDRVISQKLKQKRKRKRRKDNVDLDEASRLQRKARYLLIKMKREKNLIDAYSAEGWKGQSREKIRPEKELQRAKKQILKCKLEVRDAIRQLDSLSSVGCIEGSVIVPPGEQGWFCKVCDCKMGILEATNAHLGTHFSVDSNWQDIFKEEASLPEGGDALLNPEEEWPSDDSEDDDYDPENFESSCSYSRAGSEANASNEESSSSSLYSLESEVFGEPGSLANIGKDPTSAELFVGADTDETTDCEITNGRRQRGTVDYKKLYDEMFGKDAPANEQISEDEDWGPTKRKRRRKESDAASTLMTLCATEKRHLGDNITKVKDKLPSRTAKRPLFRIPHDALGVILTLISRFCLNSFCSMLIVGSLILYQKLRLAFAENELPSKAVRENLSKELGIEAEKVNKWFKNARYLALKARKAEGAKPFYSGSPKSAKESGSNIYKQKSADQIPSKDVLSGNEDTPKKLKKAALEFEDDESLKLLREKAKRRKKRVNLNAPGAVQEAEAEMERLCNIIDKVEKLQRVLLGLPNCRGARTRGCGRGRSPRANEFIQAFEPKAQLNSQSSLPSSIKAPLSFVSEHGKQEFCCDWISCAETWQNRHVKCQGSCGNVVPDSERKNDDDISCTMKLPASCSQLSSITTMSESSAPTRVYKRKKFRTNYAAVFPAQASSNAKPNENCVSAITFAAPSVAAKEHADRLVVVETGNVRAPVMLQSDCNKEDLISTSGSIDGCFAFDEPDSEEPQKSEIHKVADSFCVHDSCSSSKSNTDLGLASLKTEMDDTGECSSSGALMVEALRDDLSEKEICISILGSLGLLERFWPIKNHASADCMRLSSDSSSLRPCKLCDKSETTLNMLICDQCEDAFHVSCCKPSIKSVPLDEWFCLPCSRKKRKILREINDIDRCRNLTSKDASSLIEVMLKDTEPHTSNVRVGKGFQANIPDWCGPDFDEVNNIIEPWEMHPLERSDSLVSLLVECLSSKPSKLSSIGNWLQCRQVVEGVGKDVDGTICGKWRR